MKKRIALLECQLQKSEIAKKGFEVSTGKLLRFVEVMYRCLSVLAYFTFPSHFFYHSDLGSKTMHKKCSP